MHVHVPVHNTRSANLAHVARPAAPNVAVPISEVLSRWGSVTKPVQPVAGVARAAYSIARRAAHTIDFDLLGDELDTTLGLIADDLAAAGLRSC